MPDPRPDFEPPRIHQAQDGVAGLDPLARRAQALGHNARERRAYLGLVQSVLRDRDAGLAGADAGQRLIPIRPGALQPVFSRVILPGQPFQARGLALIKHQQRLNGRDLRLHFAKRQPVRGGVQQGDGRVFCHRIADLRQACQPALHLGREARVITPDDRAADPDKRRDLKRPRRRDLNRRGRRPGGQGGG